MNYTEQKALYESIMKEVAETLKKSLNESFGGSKIKKIFTKAIQFSKEHPETDCRISIVSKDWNYIQKMRRLYSYDEFKGVEEYYLTIKNGNVDKNNSEKSFLKVLGELNDDCFIGDIITDKYEIESEEQHNGFVVSFSANKSTVFIVKLSDVGINRLIKLTVKLVRRENEKPQSEEDFLTDRNSKRTEKIEQARENINKKKAKEYSVDDFVIDVAHRDSEKIIRDFNIKNKKNRIDLSNEDFYKLANKLENLIIDFYKNNLKNIVDNS